MEEDLKIYFSEDFRDTFKRILEAYATEESTRTTYDVMNEITLMFMLRSHPHA